jgi:hypothetical protein
MLTNPSNYQIVLFYLDRVQVVVHVSLELPIMGVKDRKLEAQSVELSIGITGRR